MMKKIDAKLEKLAKRIGLVFLCIVVIWTTWWTCETVYVFGGYLRRGFDTSTAWEWTMNDIDYEMEELNKCIENLFPKKKERRKITEYPVVNWNIDWNVMNKP